MDPMEPIFEDLLVEQAARHFERVPGFEGIAIDRIDYSENYNYERDDGVSFVPMIKPDNTSHNVSDLGEWVWGPARSLRTSYRHTTERLHRLLHTSAQANATNKRAMFQNFGQLARLELNRHFDGTFSELANLNANAWIGLRAPTILWTYSLDSNATALDEYFQQHLLMDAYPMAPMHKNDHSIAPANDTGCTCPATPMIEALYRDYGRLFDAMHGARWLLTAQPASVDLGFVNIFTKGHAKGTAMGAAFGAALPELVVPIMLALSASNAQGGSQPPSNISTLTLNLEPAAEALGWPQVVAITAAALYPGMAGERELGSAASVGKGLWRLAVPLERGCALVRVTLKANTLS